MATNTQGEVRAYMKRICRRFGLEMPASRVLVEGEEDELDRVLSGNPPISLFP